MISRHCNSLPPAHTSILERLLRQHGQRATCRLLGIAHVTLDAVLVGMVQPKTIAKVEAALLEHATQRELAAIAGVSVRCMHRRIALGWPLAKALSTPATRRNHTTHRCIECDGTGHNRRTCPAAERAR